MATWIVSSAFFHFCVTTNFKLTLTTSASMGSLHQEYKREENISGYVFSFYEN